MTPCARCAEPVTAGAGYAVGDLRLCSLSCLQVHVDAVYPELERCAECRQPSPTPLCARCAPEEVTAWCLSCGELVAARLNATCPMCGGPVARPTTKREMAQA